MVAVLMIWGATFAGSGLMMAARYAGASSGVIHSLRATGAVGYSMDLMPIAGLGTGSAAQGGASSAAQSAAEKIGSSWGVAPALGFGYRMQYRHFLLDAGVELGYRYRSNTLLNLSDTAMLVDYEGDTYKGYSYYNSRKDAGSRIGVNIPIAIGFEAGRLYGLLGAKAGMNIWQQYQIRGLYTHEGEYEQYIDLMKDVPEAGFVTNEAYEEPMRKGFSMDVLATAELGVRLGSMRRARVGQSREAMRYYIGVYAEYALMKMDAQRVTLAGMPLTVGVKATVLMPLKEKRRCVICEERRK